MAKIIRGPGSLNDYNVKGVKYIIEQDGKKYSEYIGDGKEERKIPIPLMGNFTIREKK